MALFSKPPAKKPHPLKIEPRIRPAPAGTRAVSAREVVDEAAGKTRPANASAAPRDPRRPKGAGDNVIEWAPAQPAIEVAPTSALLCGVLENAALLFASGQMEPAQALLEEGIANDHDARTSDLAWLALFDLLQRAGDKTWFDQLALRYVVQFEQSAPAWEDAKTPAPGLRTASRGGYVGITGKLTAASVVQIDGLLRISAKDAGQARLDLSAVTGCDGAGARLLADALGAVRRQRAPLLLERAEKLRPLLETAVNQGREAGEGAWLLLLELLQWQGDQAAFDDRAVEYAVTFEMSPPSWEPPAPAATVLPAAIAATEANPGDAEVLEWSGAVTGAAAQPLAKLLEFAQTRSVVSLDMTQLERIDFASCGALVNVVNRLAAQRKMVQIAGATAMIRALLFLVGLPPQYLVKKVA